MDTEQKRNLLINYLNMYLSKRTLKMKPVMKEIKRRIEKDTLITRKQFNSIIKFLEREPKLLGLGSRTNIYQFFSPFIKKS